MLPPTTMSDPAPTHIAFNSSSHVLASSPFVVLPLSSYALHVNVPTAGAKEADCSARYPQVSG